MRRRDPPPIYKILKSVDKMNGLNVPANSAALVAEAPTRGIPWAANRLNQYSNRGYLKKEIDESSRCVFHYKLTKKGRTKLEELEETYNNS